MPSKSAAADVTNSGATTRTDTLPPVNPPIFVSIKRIRILSRPQGFPHTGNKSTSHGRDPTIYGAARAERRHRLRLRLLRAISGLALLVVSLLMFWFSYQSRMGYAPYGGQLWSLV